MFSRKSPGRRPAADGFRVRPRIEALEDRTVPATSISDSGGFEGSNQTLTLAGNGGATLEFYYEHYSIPDNFIIRYEGQNLLETGFVGGSRTGTVEVPKGNSNTVQVIVATNDSGTAWDYTVTADDQSDCPDTAPFVITLAGGDFTHSTAPNGDDVCSGTGTIFIGRTDGIAQMIRVEGSVEFTKRSAKVNGTVFSLIGAGSVLSAPLFTGSFEFPYTTGTSTDFSESPAAGEYTLGGMDVDFSSISLNQDGIALGARFQIVEELGVPDFFFSGPDGLIISQNDVRFGASIRASLPNFSDFNLLGFLPIKEFSNFSVEYIAPQDAVKLQAKLVIDLLSKAEDSGDVTVDLSGNNFLQIKGGEVDVVGELTVQTGLKFPPKGWGLQELKLAVDTINRDVSGTAKLELPFGSLVDVEGKIGFKLPIPPLELNELELRVDNLNKPVPIPSFPGVFFQGFRGNVKNFAKSDLEPIEFAGDVFATLGPQVDVSVSIPLLDIGFDLDNVALVRAEVGGRISAEELGGTGKVTLVHDRFATATGTATLNWAEKKSFQTTGTFSFLDGLIQTNDSFTISNAESPRVQMGGTARVGVPQFIPFVGGAEVTTGNYQLDFSADGNYANDFVAGWGTFRIQKLGFDYTFALGFKVFLDGRVERIGSKNIPSTASYEVRPGAPWTLLGAKWEIPAAGNVAVRVEKPDGTIVEEADFAAHNIAIVDDLTNPTTKTVILLNPVPGHWDIEVVDPTGLGAVTYAAAEEALAPAVTVTTPAATVPGGLVTIDYFAADPDSDAEVRLFYDTDGTGFDGVEIVGGLAELDGTGTYTWDTRGVAPGTYTVYAMVVDGDNPPVYSYAPGLVQVADAADLVVTQTGPAGVTVGGQATYSITVSNAGPAASPGTTAVVTLPADAFFVSSSIPGQRSGNVLTFDLGSLAPAQAASFTVTVTAPSAAGTMANRVEVRGGAFDPVAANDTAGVTTVVTAAPAAGLADLEVTLSQPPATVNLRQDYTYELTVRNVGTGPATNVVLTEFLPNGAFFVSAQPSQGTSSFDFDQTVRAFLGTLAAGASATVRVTVTPFAAGQLVSTTKVAADGIDALTLNNYLVTVNSVNAVVPTAADLQLALTTDDPAPTTGDEITLTVTITNSGPGIASGINVRSLLPAGLEFVSASPDQGTYDEFSGVWDVGNVRDNLTRSLRIFARVAGTGPVTVTAEVTRVTEADPDSVPNNRVTTEDDYAAVTLNQQNPPPAGRPLVVGGSADGSARVFDTAFQPVGGAVSPFPEFGGDVRVAAGDFDGDGVRDTVLITGAGVKTVMAVVSGRDGSTLLAPSDPFGDANFTFGGFVTAGDIDGDGVWEWVVTPELRGGPRVIIFRLNPTDPRGFDVVGNFFGIQDESFRDGARAALGDVNGDGILDVFVIAAFNGGPRTALFDGADVLVAGGENRGPNKLVGDFFAAPSGTDDGRGGRGIAAGDVTGDGIADFIVTGDNLLGTGNQVTVFSGADLIAGRFPGVGATPVADFAVGDQDPAALVTVAAVDSDGDSRADLAVGSGAGQASRVKIYRGADLSGAGEPLSTGFDPFGTVTLSGVFIG